VRSAIDLTISISRTEAIMSSHGSSRLVHGPARSRHSAGAYHLQSEIAFLPYLLSRAVIVVHFLLSFS
jgi:hypothetical protein